MTKWALHFFHCLTPLHTGGEEGSGGIDRAVLRESTTGFPYIPSSTLKGAHKALSATKTPGFNAAFGSAGSNGSQGCLLWSDASILALPVRSVVGTFAWVTCPLLVARMVRWADMGGGLGKALANAGQAVLNTTMPNAESALGGQGEQDNTAWDDAVLRPPGNQDYFLGTGRLEASTATNHRQTWGSFAAALAAQLFGIDTYWAPFFRSRLLLVSNDNFGRLIREALVVEAQIQIDDNRGTTVDGSLRYTESLPTETLLVSAVRCEKPLTSGATLEEAWKIFADLAAKPTIQLGADESKGRGLVRPSSLQLW
jgi:CRISPR-associated protein Cmr4